MPAGKDPELEELAGQIQDELIENLYRNVQEERQKRLTSTAAPVVRKNPRLEMFAREATADAISALRRAAEENCPTPAPSSRPNDPASPSTSTAAPAARKKNPRLERFAERATSDVLKALNTPDSDPPAPSSPKPPAR